MKTALDFKEQTIEGKIRANKRLEKQYSDWFHDLEHKMEAKADEGLDSLMVELPTSDDDEIRKIRYYLWCLGFKTTAHVKHNGMVIDILWP